MAMRGISVKARQRRAFCMRRRATGHDIARRVATKHDLARLVATGRLGKFYLIALERLAEVDKNWPQLVRRKRPFCLGFGRSLRCQQVHQQN